MAILLRCRCWCGPVWGSHHLGPVGPPDVSYQAPTHRPTPIPPVLMRGCHRGFGSRDSDWDGVVTFSGFWTERRVKPNRRTDETNPGSTRVTVSTDAMPCKWFKSGLLISRAAFTALHVLRMPPSSLPPQLHLLQPPLIIFSADHTHHDSPTSAPQADSSVFMDPCVQRAVETCVACYRQFMDLDHYPTLEPPEGTPKCEAVSIPLKVLRSAPCCLWQCGQFRPSNEHHDTLWIGSRW